MRKVTGLRKQKGFTLIECLVAGLIMTAGILSLASVFAQGLKINDQAQIQYIAQQKAQEMLETIFTARDTQQLNWNQINNVGVQTGVFEANAQPLLAAGPDGLYGTADDVTTSPDTVVIGPGPDGKFGTADDVIVNLNPFMTRTVSIAPAFVAGVPNQNLKQITVTINWTYEGQASQYQINCLISNVT
jgi:type IV pilus modification protein PilV